MFSFVFFYCFFFFFSVPPGRGHQEEAKNILSAYKSLEFKGGRQREWNQMKSLWFVAVLGLIKHIGHEAEKNSEVLAYPLEVGELSIELARAQD